MLVPPWCTHEPLCGLTSQPQWPLVLCNPKKQNSKPARAPSPRGAWAGLALCTEPNTAGARRKSRNETTVTCHRCPTGSCDDSASQGHWSSLQPCLRVVSSQSGPAPGNVRPRGGSSGARLRPLRPAQKLWGIAQGLAGARLVFPKSEVSVKCRSPISL